MPTENGFRCNNFRAPRPIPTANPDQSAADGPYGPFRFFTPPRRFDGS